MKRSHLTEIYLCDVRSCHGNHELNVRQSGWLCRKHWPWARRENYYQAAAHGCDRPFSVLHKHPVCGMIAAKIDYIPGLLPIWGNDRTISWEPHLERTITGGQSMEWTVEYEFGWLPSSV